MNDQIVRIDHELLISHVRLLISQNHLIWEETDEKGINRHQFGWLIAESNLKLCTQVSSFEMKEEIKPKDVLTMRRRLVAIFKKYVCYIFLMKGGSIEDSIIQIRRMLDYSNQRMRDLEITPARLLMLCLSEFLIDESSYDFLTNFFEACIALETFAPCHPWANGRSW